MVIFGALRPRLFQHARYLHFNTGEGKWELLAWEGFEAATQRKAPRQGVVDVFTQQASIHFQRATGEWGSQTYWVEPQDRPDHDGEQHFRRCEPGAPAAQHRVLAGTVQAP